MFNLIWRLRSKDVHVCLNGDETLWACGKSLDEAIGNWVRTHGHKLDIRIEQKVADER
jgi:hypothetical protein